MNYLVEKDKRKKEKFQCIHGILQTNIFIDIKKC